MARRKSSSSGRSADNNIDARVVQTLLRPPVPRPVILPTQLPLQIQDERLYAPLRPVAPLTPQGRPDRITQRSGSFRRAGLRFQSPALLDICRKRKERREVIFAKGKSGQGAKARFRKQREYSRISCK